MIFILPLSLFLLPISSLLLLLLVSSLSLTRFRVQFQSNENFRSSHEERDTRPPARTATSHIPLPFVLTDTGACKRKRRRHYYANRFRVTRGKAEPGRRGGAAKLLAPAQPCSTAHHLIECRFAASRRRTKSEDHQLFNGLNYYSPFCIIEYLGALIRFTENPENHCLFPVSSIPCRFFVIHEIIHAVERIFKFYFENISTCEDTSQPK